MLPRQSLQSPFDRKIPGQRVTVLGANVRFAQNTEAGNRELDTRRPYEPP